MKNKKNKIFVGIHNIAGNTYYIAKALRKVGIDAKSFSFSIHPFGYEQDKLLRLWKPNRDRQLFQKLFINKYTIRVVSILIRLIYFIRYLFLFDTFFFISVYTFLESNLDLTILKLFRKKVYFFFIGCPERDPSHKINKTDGGFCSFCTDNALKKYCLCNNIPKKRKKIIFIEKYSDKIFAQRDTATFINNSEKIEKLYVIAQSDGNQKTTLKKFNNINKIKILHTPSNKKLKHTDKVLEAINKLDKRKIEFYHQRTSNNELLKKLEEIHVVVDQFASGHGLLAVEAMSRGCVVVCRLARWFKEDYPDVPIVSCEPEELKEVLEDLINNPQKMKKIAERSIEYFKKYHSLEAVGNYYKRILNLK